MSASPYHEKTEIMTKLSDIVGIMAKTEKYLNIMGDSKLPNFLLSDEIRKALQKAKTRGTRIRLITEITKENLNLCKDIMKFVEVRHLDKVIGNFVLSDKEYFGQSLGSNYQINQIYNNDHVMVELQNYVFENLWNNSVSHHDRSSSLEAGVDPEEVKVLSDPTEIRKTYLNLIDSAKTEISLFIATTNALQRNYR